MLHRLLLLLALSLLGSLAPQAYADKTPDPFSFQDATGMPLSTSVASNVLTITGIDETTSVSVSGDGSPQISINGGAWATSGTIANNQTLAVRLTSAPGFSTTRTATVTVGGVSDAWDVTTQGEDTTPDAFSFTDLTGVAVNELRTSNTLTITGINVAVPVTITGTGNPQISINGGVWGTSGTLTNGQTLAVRLTSAGTIGTSRKATVTVGAGSAVWWVTTYSENFYNQTQVPLTTLRESNIIYINDVLFGSVSVSGDGNPQLRVNGGEWVTSAAFTIGSTVQLRMTSASTYSTQRKANVWVNMDLRSWSVTTMADTVPDAFSFADQVAVPLNEQRTSNPVTITGLAANASVTVSGDGSPQVSINGGAWVTSGTIANNQTLAVRLTSAGDFSTTRTATVTVGGVSDAWKVTTRDDTTPDAFSFTDQFDVPVADVRTADTVTISGINTATPVAVSGDGSPEISINGGAWVTSGTIANNQTLAVRLTSAPGFSTTHTATVTVGDLSDSWDVTTLAEDTTPDPFSFTDQTDVPVAEVRSSDTVTITGLNTATPVAVSGDGSPEISINGGAWVTSGTIANNQTLAVRLASAAGFSTTHTATVTVGGASDTWDVTTRDDTTPDAFSFIDQTGVPLTTRVYSNSVTITDINVPVPVTIAIIGGTGGSRPQLYIDGVSRSTSSTIANGQTLMVSINTSLDFSTTGTATVTVGDVSLTWSVTTLAEDTTPDPFSFTDQTDVPVADMRTSDTVTITGLNTATPLAVSGDGSPEISINGGAWVTSGTITSGQTLAVRLTSAADLNATRTATVTVGSASGAWDVTTLNEDPTPDAFHFTDQVGVALSEPRTSDTLTITGINVGVPVTISGAGSPQLSINGGAWSTSGILENNQMLAVRLTSAAAYTTRYTATVTVGGVSDDWDVTTRDDTTPDAFRFTDQTGVPLSTARTALTLTITGITGPSPVTVSGDGNPQVSINGGAWTTSGTITNQQTLAVRLTSAATYSTTSTATVTVGGVSDAWDVTTLDDTLPDAFSFLDQVDVPLSELCTSNTLTITGINTPTPVWVAMTGNPQLSIDGGPWVYSGTISNGQTLAVRTISPSYHSGTKAVQVTVGSVSDTWTVRTLDDTVPNAFSFADQTGVALAERRTSNTLAITGLTASVPVAVTGDGNPEISINNGAWVTSGTIANNQNLAVRLTSADQLSITHTARVTVSTVSDEWTVRTLDDTTPDPFAFPEQTDVPLNELRTATPQTLTGLSTATPVTVVGDGNPQLSIAGGPWVTSGSISNGQMLAVRLTSAAQPYTTRQATVEVGGVTAVWKVRTLDTLPPTITAATLPGETRLVTLAITEAPAQGPWQVSRAWAEVERPATAARQTLESSLLTSPGDDAHWVAEIPLTPLTSGRYVLTLYAADSAGNTSAPFPLDYLYDQQAPVITQANAEPTQRWIDVAITEYPDDGERLVDQVWVELVPEQGAPRTLPADSLTSPGHDAQWTARVTLNDAPTGTYTLKAYARDAAGNVSAPFDLGQHLVYTDPPVIAAAQLGEHHKWLDVQVQAAPVGAQEIVAIWLEAQPTAGGEPLTVPGATPTAVTGATEQHWQARVDLATLISGRYTLNVYARDARGKVSAPFVLSDTLLDNTPPVITGTQLDPRYQWVEASLFEGPADGLRTVTRFWVTAAATEGGGTTDLPHTLLASPGADENWLAQSPLVALAEGYYDLTAHAEDAFGNHAAPYAFATRLAIDHQPPQITFATLDGQPLTAAPLPDIQAIAFRLQDNLDPQPTVTGVTLTGGDLTAPLALTYRAEGGHFVVAYPTTQPPLADGSYQLTVTGRDANENAAENTATFELAGTLVPLLAAHGPHILLPLVGGDVDVRRETQYWPLTTEPLLTPAPVATLAGPAVPQPLRGKANLVITLSADARDALVIAGQPLNPGQSLFYPGYDFTANDGRLSLPMHPLMSAALPEGRFGTLQVRIDRPLAPQLKADIHLWSPASELVVRQSAATFAKKVHPAEVSLAARGATLCAGDFEPLTDPGTTRYRQVPNGTAHCAAYWMEIPPGLAQDPRYKRNLKGILDTSADEATLRYQPGLYVVTDNILRFHPALVPAPAGESTAAGAPDVAIQAHTLTLVEPEAPTLRFLPASATAGQGDWLPDGVWATRTGPFAAGTITAMSGPYRGLVLTLRDGVSAAVLSERTVTTNSAQETVTTDLPVLESETQIVARAHYSRYPEVFTEARLTFVALPTRLTLKLQSPGSLRNDQDSVITGVFGEWAQGAFAFDPPTHGDWSLQLCREVPGADGPVREPLGAPTAAIAADGRFAINVGPLAAGTHRLQATATYRGSTVIRDNLIDSVALSVRVRDGTPVTCTLSATPAESPPGVTATVKVLPDDRARYGDVSAIQWQSSRDGTAWEPLTLPSGQTAAFGYTERLNQAGEYHYRAVTTNRHSGAEATCASAKVHIYDTPHITVTGSNYTLLGTPVTLTAQLTVAERPAEYQWVVRRGYADQHPLELQGASVTLPADLLGLWYVEVKARYLDSPATQRAWGSALATLRVALPRLHRPILTGPTLVEVGVPATYTATVNPPWATFQAPAGLEIHGEWQLPDGHVVAGDTLTYMPTVAADQRLLYRAWIADYEADSQNEATLDLRPWVYAFPTVTLKTRVMREAQPRTLAYTLQLSQGTTNGEALTMTWTFPDGVTVEQQSDTYVLVSAWETGVYPVAVQVADQRGNQVQLAENLVVGEPPPLILDTKIMVGDGWNRAPAPVTVKLYPQGKMPAEKFTEAEVRLNGELLSTDIGTTYRLDIPTPGVHTLAIKLVTSYGRDVTRSDTVTLIEAVPPTCELTSAPQATSLMVTATCAVPMGKIANYKWWVTYADAPTEPAPWGTTSAYRITLSKAHLERGVLGVALIATNDKGQPSPVAELSLAPPGPGATTAPTPP